MTGQHEDAWESSQLPESWAMSLTSIYYHDLTAWTLTLTCVNKVQGLIQQMALG